MIDVINLQRKVKLETETYRIYVRDLPANVEEAAGKTLSVAFISDRRMKELNKLFRGVDATTDVLSFPHEPDEFKSSGSPTYEGGVDAPSADGVVLSETASADNELTAVFLGDIVISAELAERQAIENDLTLENEIKQLILHGLLHLCGYDHETDNGEMNARELDLREQLVLCNLS
ncbi:MAG: rRNA maturation RNase YbeY [Pyrinomonadaceae bacterium]